MRHLILSIAILALCRCVGVSAEENKVWNPTPGEICIVASTPIPNGYQADKQSYKDLVDCGFNIGMTDGSVEYFNQQFELIGDLPFKYMIQSGDLFTDKRKNYISAFMNNPKFAGWKFKDEPTYDDLQKLRVQYRDMYAGDSRNLIYVNLVGVINKRFTGPYTTLSDYLDRIGQLISPEIWSYDYYPIVIKKGKTICESEPFYYALESFSAQARKTGKPFWAYCESMQYTADSYSRPPATEAYLRFEAFSALAYGAQGIVYWTYGQRVSNPTENYLSALVNMDGKKTSAWYAAKTVNSEIKKFNDVFYGCRVLDVRHTGSKIYKGTRKLSGEFGPFKMIRSKDAGVMVSYIENKGGRYIVLVNRDPFKKQKVTLELKANNDVMDISSEKNKVYSWRKDINITLDKGGYAIFKEYALSLSYPD